MPDTMQEQLVKIAGDCGFSGTGFFDTAAVRTRQEVRDACAADKCHVYGKKWSCPPACGSLEEWGERIRWYKTGLILQTQGVLEDSFDIDGMERIGEEHNTRLRVYQDKLKVFFEDAANRAAGSGASGSPWLLLGSGGCKNCEQCTYPDSPCAFPEKMIVSMEAAGIVVSELCQLSNVPYYYGPNTLTYTGCVLI